MPRLVSSAKTSRSKSFPAGGQEQMTTCGRWVRSAVRASCLRTSVGKLTAVPGALDASGEDTPPGMAPRPQEGRQITLERLLDRIEEGIHDARAVLLGDHRARGAGNLRRDVLDQICFGHGVASE